MPEEENIQEPNQDTGLSEQAEQVLSDFMDSLVPPEPVRGRVTRRNPSVGLTFSGTVGDGLVSQIRAAEPFMQVWQDSIRPASLATSGGVSGRFATIDSDDNPYLYTKKEVIIDPKKKVKLFDGTFCFYEDCVDVFKISYFKKTDDRIVKDYFGDIYIAKDPDLVAKYYGSIMGVVTEITTKGEFVVGGYSISYTSSSIYSNSKEHITSEMKYTVSRFVIDPKIVTNSTFNYYYKEDLNTGDFYHKSFNNSKDLKPRTTTQYRKCKRTKSFKKYVQDKPNTYIKMLGKKYTFGYEIETASGYLPPRLDQTIFYDAVHDGSLRNAEGNVIGGEYVTDVLWGDLGLLQLRLLCNELSKRCTINKTCGNHIHLSGVSFNKENIVLMYYLFKKLEPFIFGMLPKSRRNNEYCRPLPNVPIDLENIKKNHDYFIDSYYNSIINILSSGSPVSNSVNKKHDHPKGFKCGYDHSAARYCWVNFIPAVFNTRKNGIYTIEFRPHSATTSYYKCKNWLFICIALIDIVENNKLAIYNNKEITLQDIITLVYPRNHQEINSYIQKRTDKFSSNATEDQEIIDYVDNEIDENLSIKNL